MIRRVMANLGVGLVIVVLGAVAAVLGWRVGRPHAAPAAPATALLQAIHGMQSTASYQFSGRVTIGVEVLNVAGRFSAPDRVDETLQLVGGPPVERVGAGTATYQRTVFGWHRIDATTPMGDPRAVTIAALLADVAAERPRVAVAVLGEHALVTGELRAVGADLITIAVADGPLYVAARQVSELTVLASG